MSKRGPPIPATYRSNRRIERDRSHLPLLVLCAGACGLMPAAAAQAQTTPVRSAAGSTGGPGSIGRPPPTSAPSPEQTSDIVVTARRGDAVLDPETELGEHDIAGYGADTIAELLGDIGPLIDGTGKAPVILVNGKRIGGASGVTGFPPEALARLAILPPAAAARYGYPAGRRVVNLVLKPKFASWDGSAGLTEATAGGRDSENGLVSRVVIDGSTYWNAQAQFSRDSMLLKSARRLAAPPDTIDLQTPVTDPDAADALLPASRAASFNLGLTHPLGSFSGSLNVNISTNSDLQWTGYPSSSVSPPASSQSPFSRDIVPVPGIAAIAPLTSRQNTTTLGISATANGSVHGWNVNAITNYTLNWSDSAFDRAADLSGEQARIDPAFDPYAALPRAALVITDRTRSQTRSLDARLIVDRTLIQLPAGPLTASLTLGFNRVSVTSESSEQGVRTPLPGLRRTEFDWQGALSMPLTARGRGAGRLLGELSASVTAGLSAIVANGVQRQVETELSWSPGNKLQIFASYSFADQVPDVAQLNGPRIETITRLYDPIREEIAEPVWITGGNPDLRRGSNTSFSLKGSWRPFGSRLLALNLGYQRQLAKGGATGFPQLTPAVEAAFPDRITRDASGRLIAIDARPIAIDQEARATLTSGVTSFWLLPGKAGSPPRTAADRWQISLAVNHSWQLESKLKIGPGLPPLDRLGGDGGQPRHLLSWQLNVARRGIGATVSGQWQNAVSVRDTDAADGQGGYRYAALAQFDLGVFIDPGALGRSPSARGLTANTRVSLDVQNLFDSYQRVTLADGRVPGGFDRYQLNPLGRTVRFGLHKRF